LHKQGLLERSREPAVPLLPVQVTTATLAADRRSTRVTRSSAQPRRRPVTAPCSSGHIEIELPSGTRVRIHGRVEPRALAEVLTALAAR
jgi:hypothetical protein